MWDRDVIMPFPRTTDGVVLRAVDYSETSQVLTFWTRDAGRLSGIAKGAKRAKSAFHGPFDLFALYRFVYREKPAGQLLLLTSADLIDTHPGLRADPARLTAASACAEILLGLTADGMPNRPLFQLLLETLQGLGDAGGSDAGDQGSGLGRPAGDGPGFGGSRPDPGRPRAEPGTRDQEPAAVNWEGHLFRFEAQALTHLGHRPRVSVCAVCGAARDPARLVRFSARAGGAVCDRCVTEEPAPLRVRAETLRALAALTEPGVPPPAPPLAAPLRQELRALLRSAYTHLLERPPMTSSLLP